MKKKKKKKIPPPVLLLTCLAVMALLRWIWPIWVVLRFPLNLLGLAPVALGLTVGLSGVLKFRKEKTNWHPFKTADKLVTDGIYAYSRNPMYLGLTLLLVGAWILFGALSPLLCVLLFIAVASHWYIPGEERMLREKFGPAFQEYEAKVGRWL